MCVNVFYITRNKISAGSDKRQRFSPWTSIIKIVHFCYVMSIIKIVHFCNVMSIDMTLQKWAIFRMEVYGEIPHFLSDPAEILFLVI